MKRIANYLIALAVMAFTFTSCEDVPSPFGDIVKPATEEAVTIEPIGSGTEGDPYNVAALLEFVSGLGSDTPSDKEIFFKGFVTETTDISAQYGNATFYISDTEDGTANKFYVFRCKGLGGDNVTDEKFIKEGDFVVMCGKVTNYKGNTPETVQGAAYVVSINGEGGGGTKPEQPTVDLGTKDAPLTVAKALEITNALEANASTDEAFVKGKISRVQSFSDQYKSITYYISDDGKEANELQIYSGKNIGGAEFTAATDLKAGDEVVVKGKLKKYVNNSGVTTLEMNQPNEIVSIVKASGGGDTPAGGAAGSGTQSDPYNVVAISEICAKLGDKEVSSQDYYIKGKICSVKFSFDQEHGTATFNISDDGKTGGTEFTCYGIYYFDMAAWVDGNKQIAVGDEVVVFGKITNYNGTLETASKKACIYSLNGETGDSGSGTGGGQTGGSEITAVFGNLDCSNVASIKLSDGTVLSCTKEDGKNNPIYHENTQIIRMYARNAITIDAGNKKIAKVVFAYDTYNGTAYKGNDEMYGEAGSSKITPTKDDTTVTFSNVNNSKLKVVNWLESGDSGGTQFRITGVTITYAN